MEFSCVLSRCNRKSPKYQNRKSSKDQIRKSSKDQNRKSRHNSKGGNPFASKRTGRTKSGKPVHRKDFNAKTIGFSNELEYEFYLRDEEDEVFKHPFTSQRTGRTKSGKPAHQKDFKHCGLWSELREEINVYAEQYKRFYNFID